MRLLRSVTFIIFIFTDQFTWAYGGLAPPQPLMNSVHGKKVEVAEDQINRFRHT